MDSLVTGHRHPLRQKWKLFFSLENKLVFFSGVLMALAFPPFHLGCLIFIALIPFLLAIRNLSWSETFRKGFMLSTVFFSGLIYWIIPITLAGFLGVLLVMGVYIGTAALLTAFCRQRLGWVGWLAFPFLYGAMEWLRSLGIMGFPWGNLGYALGEYKTLIQIAAITGVGGLSFWILLANTLGFLAISQSLTKDFNAEAQRTQRFFKDLNSGMKKSVLYGFWLGFVLLTFAGFLLHGQAEQRRIRVMLDNVPAEATLRVALLQGNIDQEVKWEDLDNNFDIYERLSLASLKGKPELIVWPETAATCYITAPTRREYLFRMYEIYAEVKTPILFGALDYEILPTTKGDESTRNYQTYNAIFYLDNLKEAENLVRYHKNRLVPFAEWIPMSDYLPIMKKLQFGQGDFTPAQSMDLFTHPKGRLSGFICFEAVFPRYVRDLVNAAIDLNSTQQRPCFLINVTNDAWFGRTSAPYQHANMIAFRAVETRSGIARAANTGISLIYNPLGELTATTDIFHETAISGQLYPNLEKTFFTRHGDVFDRVIAAFAGLWLLAMLFSRRRVEEPIQE